MPLVSLHKKARSKKQQQGKRCMLPASILPGHLFVYSLRGDSKAKEPVV